MILLKIKVYIFFENPLSALLYVTWHVNERIYPVSSEIYYLRPIAHCKIK